MKRTILTVLVLVIGGTATLAASSLKCKKEELCSVKEVFLSFDIPAIETNDDANAKEEATSAAKAIVEQNTWLRVVDRCGPGTGMLEWRESAGATKAQSIPTESKVGESVSYILTMWNGCLSPDHPNSAKVVWQQDLSYFEGIKATSTPLGDYSEAHEVHADRWVAFRRMTHNLNHQVKGCGIR